MALVQASQAVVGGAGAPFQGVLVRPGQNYLAIILPTGQASGRAFVQGLCINVSLIFCSLRED